MEGPIVTDPAIENGTGTYYEPINQTPFINSGPATPLAPTPAKHKSGQRIQRDTQVQQASYTEAAKSDAGNSTKSSLVSARISGIHPKSQLKEPVRDTSPRPVNRLKAQVSRSSTSSASNKPTKSAAPVSNGGTKAVVRTGNLDWKKFGLTPPQKPATNNVAKIKTK